MTAEPTKIITKSRIIRSTLAKPFFSSTPIALENEWKSTMDTASFRTLSPNTTLKRCGSTCNCSKIASVVTGSVAEIKAPKLKASGKEIVVGPPGASGANGSKPDTATSKNPTTREDRKVPAKAKTMILSIFAQKKAPRIRNPESNMMGGNKTQNSTVDEKPTTDCLTSFSEKRSLASSRTSNVSKPPPTNPTNKDIPASER
mmetsp:Transcript_59512/g.120944  ORF Transcript_59512/g.120944 Transcript_59512/m.120944 type:complete len:202 (+) Transcript_59512:1144-1749(+)